MKESQKIFCDNHDDDIEPFRQFAANAITSIDCRLSCSTPQGS